MYKSPYKEDCRKVADRLQAVLAGGATVNLEAGEAWSDAALADLREMKREAAQAWKDLLNHCQAGGRGKFSAQWQEKAEPLAAAVGFDSLKEHALRWFPLVDRPRTFEGDTVLSVILSKAFLLADDTHITDPSIVSQTKKQ